MKTKLFLRMVPALIAGTFLASAFPVNAAVSTASSEDVDYVLGRPMTAEEIEEQKQIIEHAMSVNAYVPTEHQTISIEEDSVLAKTVLPSRYDSREHGITTEVGYQDPYGTCWAFTAMALMESSLLSKGYDYTNLSEAHLAYYANFSVNEPLNNQGDDYMYNSYQEGYSQTGGNSYLTLTTLSAWRGAVSEETTPYTQIAQGFAHTTEEAYGNNEGHLQGLYYIDPSNTDLVKRAIMEYGAAGTAYYQTTSNDAHSYYNYDTAAYYYPSEAISNHAVTIVGWDDNYSAKNFADYMQPAQDGAWIIKNSWGTEFGDGGYFYISYCDPTISEFYVIDAEAADNYDHCYQYDLTSALGTDVAYVTSAAVVFDAKANSSDPELLEAVSIALTYSVNVDYTIQIYKNPTDPADPTSGKAMLSTPQSGSTTLAGYYTIPLDHPVTLDAGDTFAIVFSFSDAVSVDWEVSYPYEEGSYSHIVASSQKGQNFIGVGNSWYDLTEYDSGNLRIKAFTSDTEKASEDNTVYRIFGTTRYETSFAIADALKESYDLDEFQHMIIACGTDFPDALSGSYLASKKQAPILMYNNKKGKSNIDDLLTYINRNLSSDGTIYLLGGDSAIDASVEKALSAYNVKRLGGKDRYVTNLNILKEAGVGDADILVCTAQNYPDSLSCSALGKPILLVNNKTGKLTDAQKSFLSSLSGNNLYVIGGTNAINEDLESSLSSYGTTKRIFGADRYKTSVKIAETFFDQPTSAILAYAKNYPDGLCGGSLAAAQNSPLILTAPDKAESAQHYLKDAKITSGYILGGTALIDDDTAASLFQLDSTKMIQTRDYSN